MAKRAGWIDAVYPADRLAVRRLLQARVVCLASSSPRRRAILRACGVAFGTVAHAVQEPLPTGPDWRVWVRRWSLRKARSAATSLDRGVVIAADTIVVCGQHGLGKPGSALEAQSMLRRLSGRSHRVISGVAVIDLDRHRYATASAVSLVRFRRMTAHEISEYVRTGEPMDKAGAYAIQGRAARFIAGVEGATDNVIGLPVGSLVESLERVFR